MSRTENTIFTNMCMIYDDAGNVLVQDRLNSNWPGITFPGGHVEKWESFTESVIREVYEETGLTVSELQMCGIKDWVRDDGTRYVVFLYKTNKITGELMSSEEDEVFWVPLNDMPNMNLSNSMKTMLRLFCENNLTEQFFYKENGEWVEVLK